MGAFHLRLSTLSIGLGFLFFETEINTTQYNEYLRHMASTKTVKIISVSEYTRQN
jgi:hypothetical protein